MDDPLRRFIDALQRDGCDPRQKGPDRYESRCPVHKGRRRNLSICRGDDGRVLLHCHHADDEGRTCPTPQIVGALRLTMADLSSNAAGRNNTNGKAHASNGKPTKRIATNPPRGGERDPESIIRKLAAHLGPLTAGWNYHSATGDEAFRVLRFDPPDGKTFRPIHHSPNGWVVEDPPGLLPLYHLPELAAANRIYLAEGEKAADAVRSLGLIATTSAHGAQSPAKSDWSPLAGKEVVILPDHDKPGEGYLANVTRLLATLEPRPTVRFVRLDSIWRTTVLIPDGADSVEWLEIGVPDGWDNDQCRDELERVADATAPEDLDAISAGAVRIEPCARLIRASDIEARPVEWLWEPRIPLGMLTLFAGDPKIGKSLSGIGIAAAVSRGAALPTDRATPGPASVIVMSAEDDPARIIVPRLTAAGADLSRVHILKSIVLPGNITSDAEQEPRLVERPPSILAHDIELIRKAAAALGNCRLIIIDPVTAYLEAIDDHRNTALRGVLWPLSTMAEQLNCAVILVTHMSKGGATQAKHRVIGSIAYVGACRANFLFVKDRDDPSRRRVLMCDNGTNLAAEVPTLTYTVEDRGDGPVVTWGAEPVSTTADEALQAQSRDEDQQAERRGCDRWLRDTLANGPVLVKEVWRMGREEGFSRDALKRAKTRIGATTDRDGFQGKCCWRLGNASIDEAQPPIERT
ncbi:MAG: AAA family ATPase [Isosphaeraceae bacterium]